MSRLSQGLLLAALLGISSHAYSANIVISNQDDPGEGFNDPTVVVPVGGNTGTTLGEQRLIVFTEAAKRWGGLLASRQIITVNASFDELDCSDGKVILGSAGSNGSATDGTAYPMALAESLLDTNLNGSNAELRTRFNSLVDDDPDCLSAGGFYYGLDNNVPSGKAGLYPVVLHELGHGLGFSTLVSLGESGTGKFVGAGNDPDAYSRNLRDLETGKQWDAMTDAERLTSSSNDPDVVWTGAQVTADRGLWLSNIPDVLVNSPGAIAGSNPARTGQQSVALTPGGVTASMADGNQVAPLGGGAMDGCSQLAFNSLTGKIALFDETASCPTALQAAYAQVAGAVGVIIRASAVSGLPNMLGSVNNFTITIPYVGVDQSLGDDLRTNILTANVTIREGTDLNGENSGQVRIFAPSPYQTGSSVSHFTNEASPNLLMEPSLGFLPFNQVDLTLPAFEDMGWPLRTPLSVLSITPSTTGPTNADSVSFAVEFSELVENFNDEADLVIDHGFDADTFHASVDVSGSGASWVVTLNGVGGDGIFTLAIDTTSDIQDEFGAGLGSSPTSAAVVVDTVAPLVLISPPSAASTRDLPVDYEVTIQNADTYALVPEDVVLNSTGSAAGTSSVSPRSVNDCTADGATTAAGCVINTDEELCTLVLGGTWRADATACDASYVTISEGQVVSINPGVTLFLDATMDIVGTLYNNGTIVNQGIINVLSAATLNNFGSLLGDLGLDSSEFFNQGTVNNHGLIDIDSNGASFEIFDGNLVNWCDAVYSGAPVVISGAGEVVDNVCRAYYTVSVGNLSGTGTLGISLPADLASDLAGNTSAPAGPSATFTLDAQGPAATQITPSTLGPVNSDQVTFSVTFDENVLGFNDAADVVIAHSGTTHSGVAINGTGADWSVDVMGISGDGSFTLEISNASDITDLVGNTIVSSVTSAAVQVDNTPPGIVISAPTPASTLGEAVSFTVTYTGASSVSLSAANVQLQTTGSASAMVSVSGSGASTRTVTLEQISGAGSLGISLAGATAADSAGNQAPAAGPSTTVTVQQSEVIFDSSFESP